MFTAVPFGTAFASPAENPQQQEQLIHQQVIMGYFDVWRGNEWQDTNNDGVPDAKGDKNKKTKPFTYSLDEKVKEGWQITRVEVQYPFSENEYVEAGGRMTDPAGNPLPGMMAWGDFWDNYLIYLPQNLSVNIYDKDLANGKAQVQWNLDLEYLNKRYSLDLTKPENRTRIGYEVKDISKMVEGWRWYLPGIIKWYGIKEAVPDFSTKLEKNKFSNVKPGEKLTSTVTYSLNKDHPQAEIAWLRLHHVIDGKEYPITLEPLNPADKPNEKGYIELQPGESKTYRYSFTAQNTPSKIVSRINPISTSQDRDWSNNRDEAIVEVAGCDISVKLTPQNLDGKWLISGSEQIKIFCVTKRKDNLPIQIPVRLTVNGPAGTKVQTFTLAPGGKNQYNYVFTATSSGTYTITAEAWPTGDIKDIYPADNKDQITISVVKENLPPGDSRTRANLGGR